MRAGPAKRLRAGLGARFAARAGPISPLSACVLGLPSHLRPGRVSHRINFARRVYHPG